MDSKKVLSLCMALLLVAAFSSDLFAQAVDPAGIKIQVLQPADSTWAGIGDSVIVQVTMNTGLGPAVASMVVGIFPEADTLVFGPTVAVTGGTSDAAVIALANAAGAAFENTTDGHTVTGAAATAGNGEFVNSATKISTSGSIETWRVAFGVDAGDGQSTSKSALVAQVFVDVVESPAVVSFKAITNITTKLQSTIATFEDPAGDGARFGIDGQRPVATALFDSVLVDTAVLTGPTFGSRTTAANGGAANNTQLVRSFKKGSQLIAKMRTKSLGGSGVVSGKVFLFDANNTARQVADSAYYSQTFTVGQLVTGLVTDTFAVADGIPNNTRVKAVAFLTDAAGNLSSAAAGDATAKGFSQDIVYVGDTTDPVITVGHPVDFDDPDSNRFTAEVSVSKAYVNDLGTHIDSSFALRPLTFSVSEPTSARKVYAAANDTVELGGSGSTASISEDLYDGTDTLKVASFDVDGVKFNLGVRAIDSVGNQATVTINDVWLDEVASTIKDLFPSTSDLPEDTINEVTRHPVFQIDEVVDSISVRYVSEEKLLSSNTLPHVITSKASASLLTITGEDIQVRIPDADSLLDEQTYSLQMLVRDLAGNITVTAPDSLKFDRQFNNPTADSFFVAVTSSGAVVDVVASPDSVIAGGRLYLTVTAIDTQLTRQAGENRLAVTYDEDGVIIRAVDVDPEVAVTDIFFVNESNENDADSGVENISGTSEALLNSEGWNLGIRTIGLGATRVRDNFHVIIEAADTSIVDGEPEKVVKFSGRQDSLTIDNAEFVQYDVSAWEGGEAATGVSGDFQVMVVPSDSMGNPSVKSRRKGIPGGTRLDDNAILDTRLEDDGPEGATDDNLIAEIFVEFSANIGGTMVPPGPQPVSHEGSTFTVVAPDAAGEGLVVTVRTANTEGDPTSVGVEQDRAQGSTESLTFAPFGEAPPTPAGAPEAPANLIVQDYMGADGEGDQGGFVLAAFPHSASHASVSQYRLYREIWVSTGLAEDGTVMALDEPVLKWVPWSVVDAIPVAPDAPDTYTIIRVVVPTVDNVATNWAVAAEKGGSSSERTVAGKRVFTKESVQLMVQLLGLDPNRVMTPEELNKLIAPPKDYVKSILGEQENLLFAALDPDISRLLNGSAQVPQSIRTAGGEIISSGRTATDEPARAVDNIPPAAVTDAVGEASGDGAELSWKPSTDDRIVGFISYRGMVTSIAGVDRYEVLRGADEESLETIMTLSAGSDGYTDSDLPSGSLVYRVDALDLDNRRLGETILIGAPEEGRISFLDADDQPVFIVSLDGTTPFVEDFEDFIAFAGAFNAAAGDPNYVLQADTDDSGTVDFTDFINFAGAFNRQAATRNGQPIPAGKPIVAPAEPGANENAELSLNLESDRVLVGETVALDVSLANVKALQGYGFVLNYDTDKFEFVEALPAQEDLLKSTGGETPLFLNLPEQPGQVTIANAVINGTAVSGGGSVVRLTFKVLREFEENARFEIGDGIVFDHKQLSNPVVTMGVLEVQSTPTEFALLQNFPNPFNPETTIKYNLAESADVHLQIYNVVGQVVRTLVAERQSAGRYQVRWNGTDDRGMAVASGIYFYHVSAGKFQDVRKLMLLK
jgi:hypothetical protein